MNSNNSEISKYLNIAYKRRYIFIAVALLVMTSITIYGYLIPHKYEADCTIYVEKNIIDNLVEGIAVKSDVDESIKYFKYALLSREMIARVLDALHSPVLKQSKDDILKYISGLQNRTRVEVKKGNLFEISIVDRDAAFAQNYINTLVRTYIDVNVSSGREETLDANRFLDAQLKTFKAKLDKAENAIIDFRRRNGVYFSLNEDGELADIKQYLADIEKIELDINTAQARKKRLSNQLATVSPTVDVLSQDGGDSHLVGLEKRLRALRLLYTESYPEVVRLKSEIREYKARMADAGEKSAAETSKLTSVNPVYQDLQQQLFKVDTEISSLEAKKANLEKIVDKKKASLRDVPTQKKELGLLVQERDNYRQIYQKLLQRMGQSEVSTQVESADKAATFRIVDPAVFPQTPILPDMVRIILAAIAAGLGCGFGATILIENLDSTIKEAGTLEALGIEVLAIIPRIDDERKVTRTRRVDYLVYGISGLYSSGFVILLIYELSTRFHH